MFSNTKYTSDIHIAFLFSLKLKYNFRIGASGLLTDIERQLFHWVTGRYAAQHELAMS